MKSKGTVILVPHYKGAFETFFQLAMYLKDNGGSRPYFVFYFDADAELILKLKENHIGFTLYKNRYIFRLPAVGAVLKIIYDLLYSVRLFQLLTPVQAMVCAVEGHCLEYALISVLNRKKINTIVLQWAQSVPKDYYVYVNGQNNNWFSFVKNGFKNCIAKLFGVRYARFYGDGQAKYFAVMGEYYRQMFLQQGVDKEKLVVTGHPEHDYLYELSKKPPQSDYQAAVKRSFNLDTAKPVWVYAREAISYFKLIAPEKDKQDIRTVLQILSRYLPQVQIVLKLHPRDSEDYYDFVRREFPHIIVVHSCNLYDLISISDLYVSQISSTMMWAIALDKPVITFDFNNQPYWHYFRDKEGLIKADSPEELAAAVSVVNEGNLGDDYYRQCQIARSKYMVLDGKACQRIYRLIEN